jgi:hypothetical protein
MEDEQTMEFGSSRIRAVRAPGHAIPGRSASLIHPLDVAVLPIIHVVSERW